LRGITGGYRPADVQAAKAAEGAQEKGRKKQAAE
jgi:hypothetical protein